MLDIPESVFGGFNWFSASSNFARILSKSYERLFSVSATLNSKESYKAEISDIKGALERWRSSIPEIFRPGKSFRMQAFSKTILITVALRVHFLYYNLLIAVTRLEIHIGMDESLSFQAANETLLMDTARSILELTGYIDVGPYMPLW
jgi:hypothetical protein